MLTGISSRSFLSCSWTRVSMNGSSVPRRCGGVPWPCSGTCGAQLSPLGFFTIPQDMCKIALMYCRLIKERAEALSLSEQNEGEAANRVGIGAGSTLRERQDLAVVLGQRGRCAAEHLTSRVWVSWASVGPQ